ncbi:MAG TPA: hypothetical protein VF103_16265 [Polyangiaceae bacterium]
MKRALCSFLLTLAALGSTWPCFAEDTTPETTTAEVERCVEAHDNARVLMLEEKWLEAREGMTRCQNPACPLAIRSDCGAWIDEVVRILPTLLVVVERDDDGRAPVELELDGRKLELPNPPHPIELLPGTHLVRVNLASYAPVERVVMLDKGEKNHIVRVQFAKERPPPPPPPAPAEPRTDRSRPIPAVTYALAGGAVAAFTTAGIFLGTALSAKGDAEERCAPECPAEDRQSVDGKLLAADIFGGIGLVLGGFAVYTFVTRPTVESTALAPKLEVARKGATLSVEGRF